MCKKAGLPPNEFSGDKTAVHQRLEEARAAKKLQSPADQPTGTASAILVYQEPAHDAAFGYDNQAGGSNTPGFTSPASNNPSSATAWVAYSEDLRFSESTSTFSADSQDAWLSPLQVTQGPLHPCGICSAEENALGYTTPCACGSFLS